MDVNTIVRSEVSETGFGFYSDYEKKNVLSMCRITSIVSEDDNGNLIDGGLYDPRMGPVDSKAGGCHTCGLTFAHCPGHCGHIELEVPVYYPILFPAMFQLLRSKCVHCHKLRMLNFRVRLHLIKLKLIEMGEFEKAETLFDMVHPSTAVFDENEVEPANSDGSGVSSEVEATLKLYETRYRAFLKVRAGKKTPMDLHTKALQRDAIASFQKATLALKVCENCGSKSPSFRKDGFTKIFEQSFSSLALRKGAKVSKKTALAAEAAKKMEAADADDHTSASPSDDDDEEEGSSTPVAGTRTDKYLAPLEVESQIRLLWSDAAVRDMLNYIWFKPSADLLGSTTKSSSTKSSVVTSSSELLSRAISGTIQRSGVAEDQAPGELDGWKMFFMRVIVVAPNKFRPFAKIGDQVSDHPQNSHLKKILEHNNKIFLLNNKVALNNPYAPPGAVQDSAAAVPFTKQSEMDMSKLVSAWIELQNAANCYMDSGKDPNPLGSNTPAGIRQLLERKEGLFRKHMMGKRVNYCCRSVISPDPYIGTDEVGIPVQFAKTLHYPTTVNEHNAKHLMMLVERGPFQYPGANQIETPDGRIIKLEKLSAAERAGKAKLLTATPGIKVYRHLVNGDKLLVNRQPTLHKAGVMAHKARVLTHVKEQTLRLHYANCNTYNADFDGDEMNCHFVQSELAVAEASFICNTNNQYIVATSGNPLRGLIQDHVASGVKMTSKNTFLTKGEYNQLLYIALTGLSGTEIVAPDTDIVPPPPAILKPQPLWTGKQVISGLLQHICREPIPALHLDGKTRTPATAFGVEQEENEVVIRHSELLKGVMDKAAVGNSTLGVVHAVYETCGADAAGKLLNAFGRLFTYFLQDAGHTCGIADLTLTAEADSVRRQKLGTVLRDSQLGLEEYMRGLEGSAKLTVPQSRNPSDSGKNGSMSAVEQSTAAFMRSDRVMSKVKLDGAMQSVINKSASDVIKSAIPGGLNAPFLQNNFSMMVLTGAKGSSVNQSQISCFLGQQALEGQRVPVMASGKTLPSFRAFDAGARAGGFVGDRFLTGVRPQEYYFHCMAGREGLVDTAVKTSRSGYLQRCLVKHLEELKVHYDMTVRDSAGGVVQFLYGEDGLDPTQATLLGGKPNQMLFLSRNHQSYVHKYKIDSDLFAKGLETDTASDFHKLNKGAKASADEALKLLQAASPLPLPSSPADISRQLKALTTEQVMEVLKKNMVVLARRKVESSREWSRSNLQRNVWEPVIVLKVRPAEKAGKVPCVDIQYADGETVKKVPLVLMAPSQQARGTDDSTLIAAGGTAPPIAAAAFSKKSAPALPVPLVRFDLIPATAMTSVPLGNGIGAISEKLQESISSYVLRNPDSTILDPTEGVGKTTGALQGDALELLLWVKYMRSMACPGEAVGCVAAQSVGEPSTQMTLNTFHLAGHGGANVTLGIPRLREIIMTASKNLKISSMILPLGDGKNFAPGAVSKRTDKVTANALARKLSRLPIKHLLSHRGGIEVGESMRRTGKDSHGRAAGRWERIYRIRLFFEKPHLITKAFGVKFEDVEKSVKTSFMSRLMHFIRLEQRRSGQKENGIKQFKAAATAAAALEGEGGAEEEFEVDEEDDSGGRHHRANKKNKAVTARAVKSALGSDDEDSDEEEKEEAKGDTDMGLMNARAALGKRDDADDSDDDSESTDSDDDVDDDDAKAAHKKKSADAVAASAVGDSSDSEAEKSVAEARTPAAKTSKKSAAAGQSRQSTGGQLTAIGGADIQSNEGEGWIEVKISFPAQARKLLMAQIAEQAAAHTMVRQTKDITAAYPLTTTIRGIEQMSVQTEGVNFEAIWSLPEGTVLLNEITTNDIWKVLQTYGVEAARQSIVSEISGVFAVYGIDVNFRHLSLIADYMTRNGQYMPMNRAGMSECPSPFLQMSFETTCTFLTKAATEGITDSQTSPSARIVLGSLVKAGTGAVELMVPLQRR